MSAVRGLAPFDPQVRIAKLAYKTELAANWSYAYINGLEVFKAANNQMPEQEATRTFDSSGFRAEYEAYCAKPENKGKSTEELLHEWYTSKHNRD